MGCDTPYQNPAGLRFVTRVEFLGGDPLYQAALNGPQLILNVPNGAGPGTLYLGTHDTFASWTVTDSKNLVRQTQRAYTGVASWEQLFVEDGCTVSVTLLDRDSLRPYTNDGVQLNIGNPAPRIFAQWFPAGTEITSFDRLSLCSGPAGTSNPFPLRTVLPGGTTVNMAPPGLCRFLSISASSTVDLTIVNLGSASNVTYEVIAGTYFTRAIPAWCMVFLLAPIAPAPSVDWSVCWNRYPITGG